MEKEARQWAGEKWYRAMSILGERVDGEGRYKSTVLIIAALGIFLT